MTASVLPRLPWGLLAVALAGAAVASAAVWWVAKRAEPHYAGELTLPGLAAPVTVEYGPHAVPSIRAASVDDALFAQGYLVAAERMWQMDLLRRLAGGRLAEVFGEPALGADRYFRTVGLPQAARDGFAALEPEHRRRLQRYADGVNAYRAAAAGRWPLEYRLAGFRPAPWTPSDSLVIGEYMAWINAVNLREELTFLRLAARLGTRRALGLFPADLGVPAPADARDLPDYGELIRSPVAEPAPTGGAFDLAGTGAGRLAAVSAPPAGAFSNAWAVAGRAAGADAPPTGALLANDPHLGPSLPSIWFLLELEAPGLHVAGGALPGVPLVLIGHNADLAWGLTAAVADVQDLIVERLAPGGDAVLRPGAAPEPIATRVETVSVAGRAAPVALAIRSTSHGVLIDELLATPGANPEGLPVVVPAPGHRLALRTPLDQPERGIVALWGLNTASSIAQARAAILDLRHAPLSMLIAHRDGGIGWQVGGALPARGRGSGAFPVPGWEPGFGWTGLRPPGANPGVTNPPAGRLVSANHRMLPPEQAAHLGHAWLAPFRARRIEELLDATPAPDAAAVAAMQRDRISVEARLVLDAVRAHLPAMRDRDPAAADRFDEFFADWDYGFAPDSRPAALYALLEPALYQAIYGDELGAADLRQLMALDTVTYGPLVETLRNPADPFWDDLTTPPNATTPPETPADILGRALRAAVDRLEATLPDRADQRLDRLRRLTFPHAFDANPWLARAFNLGPLGLGGDSSTVNVASVSPNAPREVGYIPSLRVVFTPADWSATRGSLTLGQSGHRFSPYRADQLPGWLAGEGFAWPWNGPAAGTPRESGLGTLRLLPAP